MLAPSPKSHCAFGTACNSRPAGREKGSDICGWCKNLSLDALYKQAESPTDERYFTCLVDGYKDQLESESNERANKIWPYLCACKDPEFRFDEWRSGFHPQDSLPCGTVPHQGQLCRRCYLSAKKQRCEWLVHFDGDRIGFPCVFVDTSLRRSEDRNWRAGPLDAQGKSDPDWEKDFQRHGDCGRAGIKNSLYQRCFNRMCKIRGFEQYFDTEWGTLHPTCGL
jgi:hypothetical protein